jgi:hypothetical protein
MNGLRALAALVAGVAIASVASTAFAASPPEPPDASEAAAPSSDAVKEAEAHFRRGVDLYKDNDSGGALVEFKRAYQLAPNYRVLFNLGQTYFQLQRYADALRTLQAFVAQGGAQIAADRRAAVEADVRQLENRVGQVEIRTNVDGAQLLVDDEAAGVAPLAQAVAVSVGHRKIAAMKPGLPTQERYVDVAAGDHVGVVLDFPATPPALAGTPTPTPTLAPASASASAPAPASAPARTGTWIAWGVTGAFGAATVVTGVLALAAKSDLSTQLDTFPGNPGAIDSARTRTKTFGVASDALLGATVLAGGVAVYVTLAGSSRTPAEVGIGPRGLQLRGRY